MRMTAGLHLGIGSPQLILSMRIIATLLVLALSLVLIELALQCFVVEIVVDFLVFRHVGWQRVGTLAQVEVTMCELTVQA